MNLRGAVFRADNIRASVSRLRQGNRNHGLKSAGYVVADVMEVWTGSLGDSHAAMPPAILLTW